MKFPESALAHKYLDKLKGIEVGASAHNPFNLPGTIANVDYTADTTTKFKRDEIEMCGETAKVDVVASADRLPYAEESLDYVVSSHVLEHLYDPIATVTEWLRVVKPGGYVYMILPHKDRTPDKEREVSDVQELLVRHTAPDELRYIENELRDRWGHLTVWTTESFVSFAAFNDWKVVEVQDVDDKVGNGFTVVLRK